MFLSCEFLSSGLHETNANNNPKIKMLNKVFFIVLIFNVNGQQTTVNSPCVCTVDKICCPLSVVCCLLQFKF